MTRSDIKSQFKKHWANLHTRYTNAEKAIDNDELTEAQFHMRACELSIMEAAGCLGQLLVKGKMK